MTRFELAARLREIGTSIINGSPSDLTQSNEYMRNCFESADILDGRGLERGPWAVIPNWGIRNIFHGATVQFISSMSPDETRGFIVRVQELLNR